MDWIFTITNLGQLNLDITEVVPNHSDFTVTAPSFPVTVDAGESEDVFVSYTPSSAGAAIGTLFVLSDDPDEGTLQVILQGFGSSPDVEFSDYSHDFDKILLSLCYPEHYAAVIELARIKKCRGIWAERKSSTPIIA